MRGTWLYNQESMPKNVYKAQLEATGSEIEGFAEAVDKFELACHPPFFRPPVRPNGSFRSLTQKANSCYAEWS